MRRGPRTRIDPAKLVSYLDLHSEHRSDGIPVRLRKFINGRRVSETDARMIRRWRKGDIQGITDLTAIATLRSFDLPEDLNPHRRDHA